MRRAAHVLIRLYPASWRRRYEAEFRELLSQVDIRASDLADVVLGAAGAHRTNHSYSPERMMSIMHQWLKRASDHPNLLAGIALVALAPSLTLVALSVLKYLLGIHAPFDAVEPYVTPWVMHPLGETVVLVAPYLAFMLVLLPVVSTRISWRESRLTAAMTISAPALNILVAALSASVAGVMVVYWLAERF